jgi:hypothetical protein
MRLGGDSTNGEQMLRLRGGLTGALSLSIMKPICEAQKKKTVHKLLLRGQRGPISNSAVWYKIMQQRHLLQ